MTLVCALAAEERAARKGGIRAARVGLGAALGLPGGPIAGFGLAGALVPGLAPGTLLTASRIVSERGETLWEGEPLAVAGGQPAVIVGCDRVIDAPDERRALAEATGAVAVDMESAVLAASGRLVGVVRAVSDTQARPVGALARAAHADGRTAWLVVLRALAVAPRTTVRTGLAARRALDSLERAAADLPLA